MRLAFDELIRPRIDDLGGGDLRWSLEPFHYLRFRFSRQFNTTRSTESTAVPSPCAPMNPTRCDVVFRVDRTGQVRVKVGALRKRG